MSDIFTLYRGSAPLLVSVPHDGSQIPDGMAARMTPSARRAPDTDWHVARLYDFARELGASILVPHWSRYVIDLNRGEDDTSLYPGQNTTGLCPVVQFNGEPVYLHGEQPDAADMSARIERYWRPYHHGLRDELDRLHVGHGRVTLWEAHSIKGSGLPFLFDGRLPDLNLGTANGASCSAPMQARMEALLGAQSQHDWVVNGRFKGGHITRHYSNPAQGIEAVQLEISQRCYMDEASFEYDESRASRLQPLLETLLRATLE